MIYHTPNSMHDRVIREHVPAYGRGDGAPQPGLTIGAFERILDQLVAAMDELERVARSARTDLPAGAHPPLDEIRALARQGIGVIEAVREELEILRS